MYQVNTAPPKPPHRMAISKGRTDTARDCSTLGGPDRWQQVVGYFEFSCSGISSATQMHSPFQLINSLPQVQERESLSLMPNGALCFVSFQASPHSHFLISRFMLRRCFRPPLFVGFPEGNQATVASSLKMKVAHYRRFEGGRSHSKPSQ